MRAYGGAGLPEVLPVTTSPKHRTWFTITRASCGALSYVGLL